MILLYSDELNHHWHNPTERKNVIKIGLNSTARLMLMTVFEKCAFVDSQNKVT